MRAVIASLLLASCGSADDAPAPSPDEARTWGVLYGIREESLAAPPMDGAIEIALGARIVRFEGIDRATVSEVLELSSFETDDVPPDECGDPVTAATLEDVGGLDTTAVVELVDVGPLEVHGGQVFRLDARSFPDLLSVVSGVVYAGPGEALEAGAELTFAAEGGGGVGAIEATSSLPLPIEGLGVGGQDPWLGAPTLAHGDDLELRWTAGAAGDEVRIEIEWMQPAGAVVLSCRAADDGTFAIPATKTRLVPELGGAGDPRMTLRRVRRTEVTATGLDEGSLVLEQAVGFPLRVR